MLSSRQFDVRTLWRQVTTQLLQRQQQTTRDHTGKQQQKKANKEREKCLIWSTAKDVQCSRITVRIAFYLLKLLSCGGWRWRNKQSESWRTSRLLPDHFPSLKPTQRTQSLLSLSVIDQAGLMQTLRESMAILFLLCLPELSLMNFSSSSTAPPLKRELQIFTNISPWTPRISKLEHGYVSHPFFHSLHDVSF